MSRLAAHSTMKFYFFIAFAMIFSSEMIPRYQAAAMPLEPRGKPLRNTKPHNDFYREDAWDKATQRKTVTKVFKKPGTPTKVVQKSRKAGSRTGSHSPGWSPVSFDGQSSSSGSKSSGSGSSGHPHSPPSPPGVDTTLRLG